MTALPARPSATVPADSKSANRCGTAQSAAVLVHLLDGRWTLAILDQLACGGRRYQDLYDALDGISYKVLTDTLRRAERDGLVCRHLDSCRVETTTLYDLTELGESLSAPLSLLGEWVVRNRTAVESARRHWDQLRRANS